MLSSSTAFLESWLASFYQFDGLILVLEMYSDETGSADNSPMIAVGGFVYDEAGLEEFTRVWGQQVDGLSKPYRTADCNAGDGQFILPDWPKHRCEQLMDDLATLTTKYALAGFVAGTRESEFNAALENGSGIITLVDSAYTLCVLEVLEQVSKWISDTSPDNKVNCWFESGANHQQQAGEFVERISHNQEAKSNFLNINSCSWISKGSAPALCSADLLLWEWQRNVLKSPDQWRSRTKDIFDRIPVHATHLTGTGVTLRAVSNLFLGLHRD